MSRWAEPVPATTLELTGARLQIGDTAAPIATLTADAPATLYLTDTAFTGSVTGALAVPVAGVVFNGTFTAALDGAAAATLVGANAALMINGVTISGAPLTLTAVRTALGWELHLTAPSGATLSLGDGSTPLLIGTLFDSLSLTLSATGLLGSLPSIQVHSAVPGVGVSGTFDGQFGSNGQLRLASRAGTLSVSDTAMTGSLELVPTADAAGQPLITITGTDLKASVFGGLLVIFGLNRGSWDLTRSGAAGSASGTGTVSVDGVAGSANATLVLGTGPLVGGAPAFLDNQPAGTASRGPPVSVQLTDFRLAPNATPITATLTTAEQLSGLISAAPAVWQIALTPNVDHTVSVATDLADIVVTVDGAAARRAASQVTELSITAAGNGTNTLAFGGVPIPVSYTGGTGIDRILGPATDTTWYVTGAGAGHVGTLTFAGVEQLVGAADNHDLFVVGAGGSLALGVDGGPGGFDTLRTDGVPGALVTYTPDGRDSGTVTVGGTATRFAGLEPVVNTNPPADLVITFDDPTDTLTVRTTATDIFVESVNHEGFQSTFPLTSITLNAGGATVRLGTVILPSTVTLTVNTAGNLTVENTVTAGTIAITSVGSITVVDGQRMSATDGDLTLSVIVSTQATPDAVQPVKRDLNAIGGLTIGSNVILTGTNVTLSVDASTQRFARYYINTLALDTTALTPG